MKKRGISEIVATVLIIAIAVVAAGIIMVWVVPMVRNNLGSNDCSNVNVFIVSAEGYTCTDLAKNRTIVMIRRGDDILNLSKVKIILTKEGNSYSAESFAPSALQTITVAINNTNFVPDKIEISPIVKSGKSEKVCSVSSSVSVPTCNLEESYKPNEVSLGNVYVPHGGGDDGGDAPVSYWQYQETANQTNCPSPQNSIGIIYVNYTKPVSALASSLWLVKHGNLSEYNISIPLDCWNADDSNKLIFKMETYALQASNPWGTYSRLYCWNISAAWHLVGQQNSSGYGGGSEVSDCTQAIDGNWNTNVTLVHTGDYNLRKWETLYTVAAPRIYEEAMWWNFG